MKLCLQARQEPKYLDWADEIIFEYRDKDSIPDYMNKYPDKTIILKCYNREKIDWHKIASFKKEKLLIATNNLINVEKCKELKLKFYLVYPICSYDELNAVLDLGSEYVRLGVPLFFDMDHIKEYYPKAKIRLIPNIAYDDVYQRANGISGTWIRPEDLNMYEDYAEVIEFNDADLSKERALTRIYWSEKEWSGELKTLITNLNSPGVNRMIQSQVTEARLNCRQKCMSHHNCHICFRALQLANEDLLISYRDAVQPKYQAPKKDN